MNKTAVVFLALAVLVVAPGCRSSGEPKEKRPTKAEARAEARAKREADMKAAIPADSPLAKLEPGMTEGEVTEILGQPDSQDAFVTGKAYNPFNVAGRDTMRMVYFYKGVGRVQFSHGSWGQRYGIVQIEHDPEEPGHSRR